MFIALRDLELSNYKMFEFTLRISGLLYFFPSNAVCSSIPCRMNLKMDVLFKDDFILLMFKS